MTIEDIGTSEITALITNNSGEEFSYGEYFSVQKQIDGQWYTMPFRADNIGFQDIAHILPNGKSFWWDMGRWREWKESKYL